MTRARIDQPLDRRPQPTLKVAPPAHVRIQGGLTESNVDYTDVRVKGTLDVAGPVTMGDTLSVIGGVKINGNVSIDGSLSAGSWPNLPIDFGYDLDFGTVSSPSSYNLNLGTF